MSWQLTPRLADAKRALEAADRVKADGQALADEGRSLVKQGTERMRQADPQYWTAAKLVCDELSETAVTQQDVADVLGRSRSYVSKLYAVGRAFKGRDPEAEGLSFDAAYRHAQEVSDYGIGREKILRALDGPAITQAELAGRTGLAQSTISEYLKEMIREGAVQKGIGRPARYEVAPVPSPVRDEHPINEQPEPIPEPSPEPELPDEEGRRRLDVDEILRFVERRVHREIQSRRLVLTPAESRTLIDELSGTITALREMSAITIVPPDQVPDTAAVSEALKDLSKRLRWASTSGQHNYYTDGATVWVVIANTRCAIVRARNDKVTVHPSDVTAHWLLTKITS